MPHDGPTRDLDRANNVAAICLGSLATPAILALCVALGTVAGCSGTGRASIAVPLPTGPANVDLWWCEEGQCVVASPPELTPPDASVLASDVELELIE